MSYKLEKPYTEKQRADFIVEYNHQQGLRIEATEMFLFALEANEIMGEKEIKIEVPDFEEQTRTIEKEVPDFETVERQIEIGTDEQGEPVYETVSEEVQTGTHIETEEISEMVQVGSHTETKLIPYPIVNPNYEEEQAQKERERLDMLSLTKREVFLALYKDKGLIPEQIRGSITDTEALIEFDYANEYYRGNPLINAIGNQLGYTVEELDYLFENKELPTLPDDISEVE